MMDTNFCTGTPIGGWSNICFVITGMLNKQIAGELGIAEHTVKNHRLNITEKLGAKSVAEMIYIAEKLNIKGATVNHTL